MLPFGFAQGTANFTVKPRSTKAKSKHRWLIGIEDAIAADEIHHADG